MEIESKIMDMGLRELFDRAKVAGFHMDINWSGTVVDEYWELPSKQLIRFRRELGIGPMLADLTIKGAEENDGRFTSERPEKILRIDPDTNTSEVTLFLAELGCKPRCRIEKKRSYIDHDADNIRIHHDRVGDMEWVEIEGDTREDLHDMLFRLLPNADERRSRVTNKTSLDLCGVA